MSKEEHLKSLELVHDVFDIFSIDHTFDDNELFCKNYRMGVVDYYGEPMTEIDCYTGVVVPITVGGETKLHRACGRAGYDKPFYAANNLMRYIQDDKDELMRMYETYYYLINKEKFEDENTNNKIR